MELSTDVFQIFSPTATDEDFALPCEHDPYVELEGGMHFDPMSGPWDDYAERVRCKRCGAVLQGTAAEQEQILDELDELDPPDEIGEWWVVDWQDDDEWWEAHDA